MNAQVSLILLIALATATGPASAITKCVRPDGSVAYTDAPCAPAARAETVQIPRGGNALGPSDERPEHIRAAIARQMIVVGMTAAEVTRSWGEPSRVNSTITAAGRREQWVYDRGRARAQYVYLERGLVTSMQSTD